MANSSRKVASRLLAAGLAIGLCAAGPAVLAQSSSHASDGRANASVKQRSEVSRERRIARSCYSLLDGRGEQVLSGGPAEAPVGKDCAADHRQHRPAVGRAELAAAPTLTVGSAHADRSPGQEPGERTAIVPRLSAGRLGATVLTTGTAILLLQSSLSTYLLILGLPFWRHVDLLPIVDAVDEQSEAQADPADTEEERAVSHVLDAQQRQAEAAGERS